MDPSTGFSFTPSCLESVDVLSNNRVSTAKPRGIRTVEGLREGFDTMRYSEAEIRQAIEKLAKVFDDKGFEVQANRDAEVTKLHAKIGQLVVERDFLAKAFDR